MSNYIIEIMEENDFFLTKIYLDLENSIPPAMRSSH